MDPVIKCPECDVLLVNCAAGAVCPSGCGNIHPKVTTEQNAKAVRQLRVKDLPEARPSIELEAVLARHENWIGKTLYRLSDNNYALWRRVRRESASLIRVHHGCCLAQDMVTGRVIEVGLYCDLESSQEKETPE